MRDYILAFKTKDGQITIKAMSLDADQTATVTLPLAAIKYIANMKYQSEEWEVIP